ncbi:hypothetical protein GCM10022284_31900 [Streptomyces hundungensis]
MAVGVILIVFGVAIAALGRLTARTYGHSGSTRTVLWLACLGVGLAVCVVGFTRL